MPDQVGHDTRAEPGLERAENLPLFTNYSSTLRILNVAV